MNLKKQLKEIVKISKERNKENNRKRESDLIRSTEDWEIVQKYLDKLLKAYATKPLRLIGFSKYIEIDCMSDNIIFPRDYENDDYIFLTNGQRLILNYKDIQRFCKQHKLKLKYIVYVGDGKSRLSNKYLDCNMTESYLIKV